ncbi:autotransporter domain-containing protein [Kosakonia sp. BK9b]|uniref:autotransporter family protein n=1 Tax=Kosakonia sp. TaxID=1916651 RepID=UPI00289686F2|nr:autotransporter domain-containing protein [Kosakonia sp.]
MMTRAFPVKPLMLAVSAALASMCAANAFATSGSVTVTGTVSDYTVTSSENYDAFVISNTGIINGSSTGLNTSGTLGTLQNNNTITAGYYGVQNQGSITILDNIGTINSDRAYGILNNGTIGVINNTGLIHAGWGYSLVNQQGTIGAINNSGVISAGTINGSAIINNATMGLLTNSGTVIGNIVSSSGMSIAGGTGGTIGTLTGYTPGTTLATGLINISSGDLNFVSGDLLLNDNVTLASGTLYNSGAGLYVSNPITLSGNYDQAAAAALNINVASSALTTGDLTSDAGYGRLKVNGAANIASGSSVNLVSQGYAFANGQRYVVVDATDALNTNYNASALNYSATSWNGGITGTSQTDTTTGDKLLVLQLAPAVVSTPGGNGTTTRNIFATLPNANTALFGLQNYTGVSDARLLNLYNASLAIGSTAEANKAGEQLSPTQNISAGAAASSTTFDMLNVIGSRITSLQVARAGGQSGLATGDNALDTAAWGQVFSGWANQGTTSEMSGYRADYTGVVLGADQAITDAWRLGAALSYTSTNVKGKSNLNGSNSYVNSWGLTAYANYIAERWYTSLYATAVTQQFNTQRKIDFTGYTGTANGKFDGQQYALKAEVGYPLALTESVSLTPLANLSYSFMHQEGYKETNGNGAALAIDAAHSDAIKSGLGAKLDTVAATPWGDVSPYVQVLWYHQYDNKPMNVSASYAAAVDETRFTSQGSTPEKDSVDASIGATLIHSDTTSVTAYYDITAAQDYTNQSVSLRFKKLF